MKLVPRSASSASVVALRFWKRELLEVGGVPVLVVDPSGHLLAPRQHDNVEAVPRHQSAHGHPEATAAEHRDLERGAVLVRPQQRGHRRRRLHPSPSSPSSSSSSTSSSSSSSSWALTKK